MPDDVRTLDKDCDLVYSPDDYGYYLQQYKLDGKGTTRTSKLYITQTRAIRDYDLHDVNWGKWS